MDRFFQKRREIPRVVIRTRSPWQIQLAAILVGCLFITLLSWGMYEAGKQSELEQHGTTGEQPVFQFDPGSCRQTRKQQLCTQIGELIQQIQIDHTANQSLAEQVKILAQENDQLKEKLVFLQHLIAKNGKNELSIYQFSLKETETPGKYRYALTLIQGDDKPGNFKGSLRFEVKLSQKEQSKVIPLINKNSQPDFPIEFKFLHRLDESFIAPPDTMVESIQVQVYKNGRKKAILTETIPPAM